jgi:hypothetical protein
MKTYSMAEKIEQVMVLTGPRGLSIAEVCGSVHELFWLLRDARREVERTLAESRWFIQQPDGKYRLDEGARTERLVAEFNCAVNAA